MGVLSIIVCCSACCKLVAENTGIFNQCRCVRIRTHCRLSGINGVSPPHEPLTFLDQKTFQVTTEVCARFSFPILRTELMFTSFVDTIPGICLARLDGTRRLYSRYGHLPWLQLRYRRRSWHMPVHTQKKNFMYLIFTYFLSADAGSPGQIYDDSW